jgi:hypothetical protein
MSSRKNDVPLPHFTIKLGVQIVVLLALVAVSLSLKIPMPVVGAALLTIIVGAVTVSRWRRLEKKQMAGLVWLTLGALVLCVLFVIREYVSPIRVAVLHIAVLLLPPLFLMKGNTKPKE